MLLICEEMSQCILRNIYITIIEGNKYLLPSENQREAEASSRFYVAKYRFSTDDPQALTFIPGDVIQVCCKRKFTTRVGK